MAHHRFRTTRRYWTLLFLSVLVLPAACAETPGPAQAEQPRTEVTIEGIAFDPDELTVEVGDTVTWINKDEVDHTVTSGEPGEQGVPGVDEGTKPKVDGLFDDALERAGSTSSFTFEERGTFVYFCRIHAAMKAVVVVE